MVVGRGMIELRILVDLSFAQAEGLLSLLDFILDNTPSVQNDKNTREGRSLLVSVRERLIGAMD